MHLHLDPDWRADVLRLLRARGAWIAAAALLLYAIAIWFDLPTPAGTKYAPPPTGAGLQPASIWDPMQALRGWGVYSLKPPSGWAWPFIPPAPRWRWSVILGAGLLGLGWLVFWERRAARRAAAAAVALAGLVVLGYLLQWGALWLKDPHPNQLLTTRIADNSFTGFFTSATQTDDPDRLFGGYLVALQDRSETRLCGHCRTHPPGPILLYWLPMQAIGALPFAWQAGIQAGLVRLLGASPPVLPPAQAIVALLGGHALLAGAALIVLPLYGLARLLAGPALALRLAAFGLLLPGPMVMTPELDPLYAVLAALLFYLALLGLRAPRGQGWWGFGTGVLLASGLYLSFGLWVLAVPLAAFAVFATLGVLGLWRAPGAPLAAPLPWPRALLWLGAVAAGTAVPWALLWGATGFPLADVVPLALYIQLSGITARRPYDVWVIFNLIDFLQFVGLPLVVALLLLLFRRRVLVAAAAGAGPGDTMLAPPPPPAWPRRVAATVAAHVNLYDLLLWLIVLGLDISGAVRAEVGRIWIFLMPIGLLALYQATGQGRLARWQILGLMAAQALVLLLIASRWYTPIGCCP